MNRSRFLFFLISALLVLPILTGALLNAAANDKDEESDSLYKFLSVFTDVLTLVRGNYVEETNFDSLMAGALDGATDALDPFAQYLPPGTEGDFLELRDRALDASGVLLIRERGMVYVVAVISDSPADEAGLKAGDLIAKLAGVETRTTPMWQILEPLAAADGSTVALEVLRYAEALSFEFDLAATDLKPVRTEIQDGVGVLTFSDFSAQTSAEVAQALETLREAEVDRVLLDVRGIAWGDPHEAYKVAAHFASGEIGHLLRGGEIARTFIEDRSDLWSGSVGVVVDRSSLGAAEVLATVLRQSADAQLIGEPTFGFAGDEGVEELSNGGRLVLAKGFFAGADATPISEKLQPDVAVYRRGFGDEEEPEDHILERAIEHINDPEAQANANEDREAA